MSEATGLALILEQVGQIITSVISWMGQVFTFILAPGHELALIALLLPFIGLAIHWFHMMVKG